MSKRKQAERAAKLAEEREKERETARAHGRRYRMFRQRLRNESVRYGLIPETIIPYLRPDKLTAAALRVYIYLLIHANERGEYYKSIDLIAADLNLDVRSVQRGLNQLRKLELVWPARFSQKSYSRYFLLPFGPQAANLDLVADNQA
jgi:hypothetical protein